MTRFSVIGRGAAVATVDGWDVSVSASDLSVHQVPNLAGSIFTREGFISATVTGEVRGHGSAPVRSGKVEQGVQVGCGVDVSSGATLGLNATFGPNVGITMAGLSGGVSATMGPSVSMQVRPGRITSLPLGHPTRRTRRCQLAEATGSVISIVKTSRGAM